MTKRHRRDPTDELGALWLHWTELITRLQAKRRKLMRVSESKYRKVHGQLVASLTTAIQHPSPTIQLEEKELRELHTFCQPWSSVEALQTADRRVLTSLVKRGEELCFEHFGRKSTSRLVLHVFQLLAATCLLTIVLAGTVGKSAVLWENVVSTEIRSQVFRAWFVLGNYSGLEWLGIATCAVVIIGVWMLSSTRDW